MAEESYLDRVKKLQPTQQDKSPSYADRIAQQSQPSNTSIDQPQGKLSQYWQDAKAGIASTIADQASAANSYDAARSIKAANPISEDYQKSLEEDQQRNIHGDGAIVGAINTTRGFFNHGIHSIANTSGTFLPYVGIGMAESAASRLPKTGAIGAAASLIAGGNGAASAMATSSAGATKQEIYDRNYEEQLKYGASEEQARAFAENQASYTGPNAANIAGAGTLGYLAGKFGTPSSVANIGRGSVAKMAEDSTLKSSLADAKEIAGQSYSSAIGKTAALQGGFGAAQSAQDAYSQNQDMNNVGSKEKRNDVAGAAGSGFIGGTAMGGVFGFHERAGALGQVSDLQRAVNHNEMIQGIKDINPNDGSMTPDQATSAYFTKKLEEAKAAAKAKLENQAAVVQDKANQGLTPTQVKVDGQVLDENAPQGSVAERAIATEANDVVYNQDTRPDAHPDRAIAKQNELANKPYGQEHIDNGVYQSDTPEKQALNDKAYKQALKDGDAQKAIDLAPHVSKDIVPSDAEHYKAAVASGNAELASKIGDKLSQETRGKEVVSAVKTGDLNTVKALGELAPDQIHKGMVEAAARGHQDILDHLASLDHTGAATEMAVKTANAKHNADIAESIKQAARDAGKPILEEVKARDASQKELDKKNNDVQSASDKLQSASDAVQKSAKAMQDAKDKAANEAKDSADAKQATAENIASLRADLKAKKDTYDAAVKAHEDAKASKDPAAIKATKDAIPDPKIHKVVESELAKAVKKQQSEKNAEANKKDPAIAQKAQTDAQAKHDKLVSAHEEAKKVHADAVMARDVHANKHANLLTEHSLANKKPSGEAEIDPFAGNPDPARASTADAPISAVTGEPITDPVEHFKKLNGIFSRIKAGSGKQTPEQMRNKVRDVINSVMKGLGDKFVSMDNVKFVTSDNVPAELGSAKAYVDRNGDVVFVADRIDVNASKSAIFGVVLHEVGVHAGLKDRADQAEYKRLSKALEDLRTSGSKEAQDAWDRVPEDTGKGYPEEQRQALRNEEFLAYFAEMNPNTPIAKRFMVYLRKALRFMAEKLGMDRGSIAEWANKVSDSEIIMSIHDAFKLYVENGTPSTGEVRSSFGKAGVIGGMGKTASGLKAMKDRSNSGNDLINLVRGTDDHLVKKISGANSIEEITKTIRDAVAEYEKFIGPHIKAENRNIEGDILNAYRGAIKEASLKQGSEAMALHFQKEYPGFFPSLGKEYADKQAQAIGSEVGNTDTQSNGSGVRRLSTVDEPLTKEERYLIDATSDDKEKAILDIVWGDGLKNDNVNPEKVIKKALELGADINARDFMGRTPLFHVDSKEHAKLLIDNGADVNAETKFGLTPLHIADTPELAKYLLEKGANREARDDEGKRPGDAIVSSVNRDLRDGVNVDPKYLEMAKFWEKYDSEQEKAVLEQSVPKAQDAKPAADPGEVAPPRRQQRLSTQDAPGEPIKTRFHAVMEKIKDFLKALQVMYQNKHAEIYKRVEMARAQLGGKLDPSSDFIHAIEASHGRTSESNAKLAMAQRQAKDFMNKNGISDERAYDIMLAQYVAHNDANTLFKSKDPAKEHINATGMSNEDAAKIVASMTPEEKQVAQMMRTMIDDHIEMARSAWLISKEQYDAIKKQDHYFPLERERGSQGTGQGLSVTGKLSLDASPLKANAEKNALGLISMEASKTIGLAEKNRVDMVLGQFIMDHFKTDKTKSDWEAYMDFPKEETQIDPATGFFIEGSTEWVESGYMDSQVLDANGKAVDDPNYKGRDNMVVFKVDGQNRAIVFNDKNKAMKSIYENLKNMNDVQMGAVTTLIGKATRWLSAMNTQYNPAFGPFNFLRDAAFASLSAQKGILRGHGTEMLKEAMKSMPSIFKAEFARLHHGEILKGGVFDELQAAREKGIYVGYSHSTGSLEEHLKDLQKAVSENDGKVKNAWGTVKNTVESYNAMFENCIRYAAYKTAIKHGGSEGEAISAAKNITVNFNQKGTHSSFTGALYSFFNSNVQGIARTFQVLTERQPDGSIKFSKLGLQILGGAAMLGSSQAMMLAAAGYGPDEPDEETLQKNFCIPNFFGESGNKDYIKIPYPLGFHTFVSMGRIATQAAIYGDAPSRMGDVFSLAIDSYNPVGGGKSLLQAITPTIVDPITALSENKDNFGRQIYRENRDKLNPAPGYTLHKQGATDISIAAAKGLNDLTGGDSGKPGSLSPTPDQLDFLGSQIGAGPYRFLKSMYKSILGDSEGNHKATDVPVLGRLVGNEDDPNKHYNRFANNIQSLNGLEASIKTAAKDGRSAQDVIQENPEARLIPLSNQVQTEIKKLSHQKQMIIDKGGDQERVKAISEKINELHKNFNDKYTAAKGN